MEADLLISPLDTEIDCISKELILSKENVVNDKQQLFDEYSSSSLRACLQRNSIATQPGMESGTLLLRDLYASNFYYKHFSDEKHLRLIMQMMSDSLSEPYSIYTFRYFIYNWPQLCILAFKKADNQRIANGAPNPVATQTVEAARANPDNDCDDECIGAIVCKSEWHNSSGRKRGYIAMLAVQPEYRSRGLGTKLVELAIERMIAEKCQDVVLETEITNQLAIRMYERLGFAKDKYLFRYYLNGVDAYRLKLWLS